MPTSSLMLLVLSVPKRFVVGGTNDRERERSQVSDGMIERTPRAWSLLGCMRDVLCLSNWSPFVGSPALPFIGQGRAGGLQMGERGKNLRWRSPFEGVELSFSLEPVLLSWQTVSEMVCSLTLAGPRPSPASASGYVPSSPTDGAGC